MVIVSGSSFGLDTGLISYNELMRISAAPLGDFGSATGQYVPGALSAAPTGTYSSSIQAQAAGISAAQDTQLISKWATANNRTDILTLIDTGDLSGAKKQLSQEGISSINNGTGLLILGAAALLIWGIK